MQCPQHHLEARLVFDTLRAYLKQPLVNRASGFVEDHEHTQQFQISADLLDLLSQGMRFWRDPSEVLCGVPVRVLHGKDKRKVRVVYPSGTRVRWVRKLHEPPQDPYVFDS